MSISSVKDHEREPFKMQIDWNPHLPFKVQSGPLWFAWQG